MDAQTRRRERRAEKQAQWKAANPLLVGVSAKPVNRPILSLNRKPKSRVESALNPIEMCIRDRHTGIKTDGSTLKVCADHQPAAGDRIRYS